MSLANEILDNFKNGGTFTLKEAYDFAKHKPATTVRGRIYDNIGIKFEKVSKGVYKTINSDCILIEGDGRDLTMFEDNSVDCIMTDHPWDDNKSNIGGDRKFTNSYSCFKYTIEDFKEKYRVLKDGHFLVELLPAENENNFKYLYDIKIMAEKVGFLYYAKVPWIKGNFVSNTGRKSKNTEDVMIFSKGKARKLRLDAKKTKALGCNNYMSGTFKMLPTAFNVEPVKRNNKIHQSEKPVNLWVEIMNYITVAGEIILDQFAGSGSVGEACVSNNRKCFLIEILKENIDNIKQRLSMNLLK